MNIQFNKETGMALIRFIVPLGASVASFFGWQYDSNLVFNILCTVAAVIAFGWSWWKNNNITSAAQMSQSFLAEIKEKEKADSLVVAGGPTPTEETGAVETPANDEALSKAQEKSLKNDKNPAPDLSSANVGTVDREAK